MSTINIKEKFKEYWLNFNYNTQIIVKRVRNRIPDRIISIWGKFVYPYLSIIVISCFVFLGNFVQAQETTSYLPNDQVMDLSPAEVAKTISVVSAYTPNFEEDPIQLALAIRNDNYLYKPVITETQTQASQPAQVGERKTTISYAVEQGDTLSTIGWKYGLKIASIKATNNLNSDMIKPGQTLKLPPQDVSASVLASFNKKRQVAGSTTSGTISPFKGTFGRPTRGWNMSQRFGHTDFENYHTGIDLTSRSGTAILASASGKVIKASRGWGGGYGNHIIISHGNGFTTLYGHMTSFSVSVGQWVNQGQQIGVMGSTGWSTGTHLHFEIRKNNSPQNPMNYL